MAPEDVPKFVRALARGKGEMINGSRMVYPMEGRAMRFLNLIANKLFALLFSWLLGQQVRDTLCGTKALYRADYERIAANRAYFGDFDPFGDFDLLFGAARLNLRIVDLAVRYHERAVRRDQHLPLPPRPAAAAHEPVRGAQAQVPVSRTTGSGVAARLAREIEHHQRIAARAELIWNWDSPPAPPRGPAGGAVRRARRAGSGTAGAGARLRHGALHGEGGALRRLPRGHRPVAGPAGEGAPAHRRRCRTCT